MDPDLYRLATWIAREYGLPGADRDDALQFALIGALEAERSFDPSVGMPFRKFASLVIHRNMKDALTAARRKKHEVLTTALALDEPVMVDEDPHNDRFRPTYADVVSARCEDPTVRQVLVREAFDEARRVKLSPLEREALRYVSGGHPYDHLKPIDNAAQRARQKLSMLREAA